MGFFSPNPQNNTPTARRRHLANMRLIIVLAGGYILYDGIRNVINDRAGTPTWFYFYLVAFAAAIVFAFILNERRIKAIDRQIAEAEAKEAQEAQAGTQGRDETDEDDEPNDLDDPK